MRDLDIASESAVQMLAKAWLLLHVTACACEECCKMLPELMMHVVQDYQAMPPDENLKMYDWALETTRPTDHHPH